MTLTLKPPNIAIGSPVCGLDVWPPTELSIFTLCTSAIVCIVATAGNFVIIMAVVKDPLKRLRTPFIYFLMNLAATDLILGGIIMPLTMYLHYVEIISELTPTLNNVVRMVYFIVSMASLLNVVVLSINRHFRVAHICPLLNCLF